MKQIQIAVRVPLAAAVAAGRSEYGEGAVALSDAHVARLSEGARALLCERDGFVLVRQGPGSVGPVEVDVADAEHALAAVERAFAESSARAARELAESEARVAAAVAASDGDWVGTAASSEGAYYLLDGGYIPSMTGRDVRRPALDSMPRGLWLSESERRDPRVALRRQAVDLASRVAEHERRYAEWRAGYDRAEAETAVRALAWRRATAAYVERHVPEYARAAREGKDVRSVAVEALAEGLAKVLELSGHTLVESHADPVDNARPRQRAYDKLDAVDALLRTTAAVDLDLGGPLTMAGDAAIVRRYATRIVRVDTCPERECKSGVRTCVELSIEYLSGTTREIYVYADGQPPHAHEFGSDE